LTVDVELHAGDEVSVANELVEDDVVGPVALPYPDHVVKTSLNLKRLGKVRFFVSLYLFRIGLGWTGLSEVR
jgi:hypothetical protein